MFTTDQKGAIAETAIIHEATKLGIDVYRPVQDGGRYDLIFDIDSSLMRVQCKWASRNGNVLIVRCYSSRRAREGLRKRVYTPDEIDAIAAYSIEIDRCYFLPLSAIYRQTSSFCASRQRRVTSGSRSIWAEDYEFAARLGPELGAIAQLGERLHGMQEVAGSSPAGSTWSSRRLLVEPAEAEG